MDRFYYEKPSLERKEDAIAYINEFYAANSKINGSGGLHRYLDNYEEWLQKLENDRIIAPSEERVPALTYFLVREYDSKIVGMVNIRLSLNEKLRESGGHIGYSIRPSERRKGYNKINLYLALEKCQEHGISEAMLSCDKNNLASSRTMIALGGVLQREFPKEEIIEQVYTINVEKSLEEHKDEYLQKVLVKK